jgi:SIR2-like domain
MGCEEAAMTAAMEAHFHNMSRFIRDGVLIPFLGAGVNACGQSRGQFRLGERMPSGGELARYLAATCGYLGTHEDDLARVSQYLATTEGDASLYRELHKVFDIDAAPTELHHLLAMLPQYVREQQAPLYPLIITTNYDDALERAFEMAGEQFDTVVYLSQGRDRGKLTHRDPTGAVEVVRVPNKYDRLSLSERPVILKLHGAVDRVLGWSNDSYVITEDHYIEYLTHTDVKKLIPVHLAQTIRESHFLFLGYGLRDWNLRVILYRLWGEQELDNRSWSVQLDPDDVETKFWERRNVDILQEDLVDYVAGLRAALELDARVDR